MIIDTHAHYDDDAFNMDCEDIIVDEIAKKYQENEITKKFLDMNLG